MGPIGHTAISGAVAGGTWAVTGSLAAAGVTLGVGVLLDLDHLYDYYQRYIRGRQNKIYVLLHAWEYSLVLSILALAFYHPWLLAVILGHLAHVVTDHAWNRQAPLAYFITYRVIRGFDANHISPRYHVSHSYRAIPRLLPFGRWLEPWFQRRIEPWFLARIERMDKQETGLAQSDD
jgi:hypothetical protein